MDKSFVLLLIFLYCLLVVFFVSKFILRIRFRKHYFYNVCFGFYIIIYSIVPLLVHLYVYENGNIDSLYEPIIYDSSHAFFFFLTYLFSIIGYFGLTTGYNSGTFNYIAISGNGYRIKVWLFAAIICLIIGIICLYVWSKVFGGPVGILEYASYIRSGYDVGINNPNTIYKRFVPLVQFANIVFFALYFRERKIIVLPLVIISTIYSLLYLIANDGRAPLAMHFVSIFFLFYFIRYNHRFVWSKIKLFQVSLLSVGILFFINNYDIIFKNGGLQSQINFDVLSSLRNEFAWTVRSNQAIFEYLEENPFSFRFPLEIASGFLGILPSSFRPDSLLNLEKINTIWWGNSVPHQIISGGRPPDLIVTGIYTLNLLGVYFLPFLLGRFLKYLDVKRMKKLNSFENAIFYSLMLYPVLRFIAYSNFDGLLINFFYIILGYLILKATNKLI